jgi:Spy/CpxP family protein refolding chaperone
MHPAYWAWHHARRVFGGHGGRHQGCWANHAWEAPGDQEAGGFGGGGFGVRRPLRFLVHKLELDERQTAELARILDDLKTERAQAEVDRRRTLSAFADALAADTFDTTKANEGTDLRVKSAEQIRAAVRKALEQFHRLLNPEQRQRLAYLIRTGTISL